MNYLFSFFVGGTTVTVLTWLARKGFVDVAGVLMVFPIITFTTLLLLPPDTAAKTATWGLVGISSLIVFLTTFLFSSNLFGSENKLMGLSVALLCWLVFSGLLIKVIPVK